MGRGVPLSVRAVPLLFLLASTAIASADELPTVDSTHPAVIRADARHAYGSPVRAMTLAVHGGDDPSWLRIQTTGREGERQTVTVDVPTGTRVIGFGIADLDHTLVWGTPIEAINAHHERSVDRDAPALVEYAGSSGGEDHISIELDQPATVELAMVLPVLDTLALEGPPHADLVATGVPFAHGVADLRKVARPTEPATAYLDDTTSLIASIKSNRLVVTWGGHHGWNESPGNRSTLRREVKLHEPVLMHCYMQEAQRDPSLRDRQVSLHLAINVDGTVDKVSLENVPASVAPCFEAEITQWKFLPMDSYVLANYPLNLKVNE